MPTHQSEWMEKFVTYLKVERRLSSHTVVNYRRDLDQFRAFIESLGHKDWRNVYVNEVRQYVVTRHSSHVNGRTIRRELSSIRMFYRFLERERQIKTNPVINVTTPKFKNRLPRTLDADEMALLLNFEKSDPLSIRDKAIMELIYSAGLRLSELVSLNQSDVNFSDDSVRVTGKGAKTRICLVGTRARQALLNWLKVRGQLAADTNALFVSRRGARLSRRSVEIRIKQWGSHQGVVGNVYPHALRHSFASHILESSGNIRAVQELLGHADISSTQIYTHLNFQHLAKVYDASHPRAKKKKS